MDIEIIGAIIFELVCGDFPGIFVVMEAVGALGPGCVGYG